QSHEPGTGREKAPLMQSLKLVLGLAAAWSVAVGCADDVAPEACQMGAEGCACRDGDCDTGLICIPLEDGDRCDPLPVSHDGERSSAASGHHDERVANPDAGARGSSTSPDNPGSTGSAPPDDDAGEPSTGSGGAPGDSGGSHGDSSGGVASGS